jgi:hypothetical protein
MVVTRLADGTVFEGSNGVDVRRFSETGQITTGSCVNTTSFAATPTTTLPAIGTVSPAVTTPTFAAAAFPVAATSIDLITSTCGQLDTDADSITDFFDNCRGIANPDQLDTDGDLIGDACECSGVICNDSNPCTADACVSTTGACSFVAGPPPEARNVRFSNASTIKWDVLPDALSYDLVRGDLAALPVGPGLGDEVCHGNLSDVQLIDGATPDPGAGFWYLTRGRYACAIPPFGWQSDGTPRNTTSCP